MNLRTAIVIVVLMAATSYAQNPANAAKKGTPAPPPKTTATAKNTPAAVKPNAAPPAAKNTAPAPKPKAVPVAAKSVPAAKSAPAPKPAIKSAPVSKAAAPAAKTATSKKAAPAKAAEKKESPKPEAKPAAVNAATAVDAPVPGAKRAPAAKRDPFVSPVSDRNNEPVDCGSGKRCLVPDQTMLRGVVKAPSGMIAVVTNPQEKAYFLRENDPVYNGYVLRITPNSVVFRETVEDRLGRKSTREVVKKVNAPVV